jgi:hypothetical protein
MFTDVLKFIRNLADFKKAIAELNWDKIGDYAKELATIAGFAPEGEHLNELLDAVGLKDYVAVVRAASAFLVLILQRVLTPVRFGETPEDAVAIHEHNSLEEQFEDACEDVNEALNSQVPETFSAPPVGVNPILIAQAIIALIRFIQERRKNK